MGVGWRIASVELVKPTKTELAAFDDGGPTPARRAEVVCLQRANNATYKGVVSLDRRPVESFDHIPGVQANFTVDEFLECDEMVRNIPTFIAALAKRGITDMDLVFVDTWTYGERRTAGVPRPPPRLVGHLAQGRPGRAPTPIR